MEKNIQSSSDRSLTYVKEFQSWKWMWSSRISMNIQGRESIGMYLIVLLENQDWFKKWEEREEEGDREGRRGEGERICEVMTLKEVLEKKKTQSEKDRLYIWAAGTRNKYVGQVEFTSILFGLSQPRDIPPFSTYCKYGHSKLPLLHSEILFNWWWFLILSSKYASQKYLIDTVWVQLSTLA